MRNWSQRSFLEKALLLALPGMAVLFLVLYLILSRMPGVEYCGALLLRHTEGETVIYSGKARGQRVEFQVSEDGAVTYLVDGQARGPYTVVLDQSAAPDDSLTGGEVRLGEEVLFRGGWLLQENFPYLEDETGMPRFELGVTVSGEKKPLPRDPSASFLIQLVLEPDLRHRGQWQPYALGLLLSLITVPLILYADKLFRRRLGWYIQNPELAEPSEWELFTRKLSWGLFSGMALVLYIIGAVTF